jgi:hypothetical protein
MGRRAVRLREGLAVAKKTSDQALHAYLKAEDALTALEEREARRKAREGGDSR